MRDFAPETEVLDGTNEPALDTSSPPRIGARHSVDAPYRDRHDALVERRRGLAREHDEAARAAARRERLARQLAVIDDQLRQDAQPLLESLEIARPCRAKWEEMIGDDVRRRCARCDRDVYDLARMTRSEAEALFAHADASPCARVRRRHDGRVVTADCPPEPPSLLARLGMAGVAGAVAGGAMAYAMTPALMGSVRRVERTPVAPVSVEVPPAAVRVEALQGSLARAAEEPVRLLGPSTYEIDRTRFASIGREPGRVRVAPVERDGASIGVRVYGVGRDGDLHALGIRNGDVILDVNGLPIAYPDQALDAYARLRDHDLFVVRLLRRGEERVHVYHVRDAS